MDFRDSAARASLRAAVRTFIKQSLPAELVGNTGFFFHTGARGAPESWREALAQRNLDSPRLAGPVRQC
jgi:hypothetical protein